MKKTLMLKLLCATITASSLIVIIPQLSTSCSKKPEPAVTKVIPESFYNIQSGVIQGWSPETLANPDSLNKYNFMQFDSPYTFADTAFYSQDESEKNAINECFAIVSKMDLSNTTLGGATFKNVNLSNLIGTAGTSSSSTAIILPSSLGSNTFDGTNLSGLTKLNLSNIAVDVLTFRVADLSGLIGTAGLSGTALVLPASVSSNPFEGTILSGLTKLDISNITFSTGGFFQSTILSGLIGTAGLSGTVLILPSSLDSSIFNGSNLSGLTKLDLTDITVGASTFKSANLTGLIGTAGKSTSSTALILPAALASNTFDSTNLSGLTDLDISGVTLGNDSFTKCHLEGVNSMRSSSLTPPGQYCFYNAHFTVSAFKKIVVLVPTGYNSTLWVSWGDVTLGYYMIFSY